MIKFITGNQNKIIEAKAVLAPFKFQAVKMDLDEIQDLNPKKVIKHKIKEAFKTHKGPFIIDDSSLFLECFNYKLPGPFVRWFNEVIGMDGYYDLCKRYKKYKAIAITYIAYAYSPKKIIYFEGSLEGKIVKPRGNYGFGYDRIFITKGQSKTLSELKTNKDFVSSPRGIALLKLKNYLNKNLKH